MKYAEVASLWVTIMAATSRFPPVRVVVILQWCMAERSGLVAFLNAGVDGGWVAGIARTGSVSRPPVKGMTGSLLVISSGVIRAGVWTFWQQVPEVPCSIAMVP